MFCYQCQEAAKGIGCESVGVCGKSSTTSGAMDVLIYVLKGLATVNDRARAKGLNDVKADRVILDGLFSTITNANFDTDAIRRRIDNVITIRDNIKAKLASDGIDMSDLTHGSVSFKIGSDADYEALSVQLGVRSYENEDMKSLKELVIYGLKGLAAYGEHALNLGFKDGEINSFIEEALIATTVEKSVDELVALTLKTGEFGVKVMALLDEANTTSYGNPEITEVNLGVRNNPGILISGHDLKDLEELLEQTQGTGVDVYTHSEMLPGHYYPKFKKHENLVGNYGNAWWKQKEEFESFNGPILFTTNCIVPPKDAYVGKMFTTGAAGWPGCVHIADRAVDGKKDFSQIIELAKTCKSPTEIETGKIVGGFAHNQVIALADKVVDAVKTGAIKKFVVMAGCDGRMKSRNYYTEFAEALPKDTVILTAGCAKYRYNKLQLGDIGGIPRVLDAGQCNDSYSLAVIALKLKEVFGLADINELPIVYNIAWYEQKAVIVLLALLSLGVKDIHLGPTLPAFLSPNVANVLINTFGIGGIGAVEDDIKNFIG